MTAHAAPPKLIVLSPELRNAAGHYLPYDLALQEGARALGLDFVVLTHRDFRLPEGLSLNHRPIFRHDIWGRDAVPFGADRRLLAKGVPTEKLRAFFANRHFERDLRAALPPASLKRDDTLFLHSLLHGQVLGLARWYRTLPEANRPRLKILFRYPLYFFDASFLDEAFSLFPEEPVCYSDSEDLARLYSEKIGRPVALLPFPHASFRDANPGERQGKPIRCVSLGNARVEKGFLEIAEAVLALLDGPETGQFEFVLQVSDPEAALLPGLERLRAKAAFDSRLVLLASPLSEEDYTALIESADVILAPYREEAYAARTSGIVADAIGAGKIVVTTPNSWPGRRIQASGTGLFCRDRDAASLGEVLRNLPSRIATLRAEAARRQREWKERNNPVRFVSLLLAGGESLPASTPAPVFRASHSEPQSLPASGKRLAVLDRSASSSRSARLRRFLAAFQKSGWSVEVDVSEAPTGPAATILLAVWKFFSLSWFCPHPQGVPTLFDVFRYLLFTRVGTPATRQDIAPLFGILQPRLSPPPGDVRILHGPLLPPPPGEAAPFFVIASGEPRHPFSRILLRSATSETLRRAILVIAADPETAATLRPLRKDIILLPENEDAAGLVFHEILTRRLSQ